MKSLPRELWIVLFLDSTAELLLLLSARSNQYLSAFILYLGNFILGVISFLVWQNLNVKWHKK